MNILQYNMNQSNLLFTFIKYVTTSYCLHVCVSRHNKFTRVILKEMGIQRVLEIQ